MSSIALKPSEVHAALDSEALRDRYPPVCQKPQIAALLGISIKTLDEWMAHGRLDGTYRRRGKRVFFWRDRVVEIIFNGKEWSSYGKHG